MQQYARVLQGQTVIPIIVSGDSLLDLRPIIRDITPEVIASGVLAKVNRSGLAPVEGPVGYLAPINGVRQIPATGFNYKKHIAELHVPTPTEPELFIKSTLALTGPFDPIRRGPNPGCKLDWETELGIVIGKETQDITAAEAEDHIFGYTILNDISDRSAQVDSAHVQHLARAKSRPTYAPIGPFVTTAIDPMKLDVWTKVNGKYEQQGNTSDMLFPVHEILAYFSRYMRLLPGDVLATGTPPGVGMGKNRYMAVGDTLECGITNLGVQRTKLSHRHGGKNRLDCHEGAARGCRARAAAWQAVCETRDKGDMMMTDTASTAQTVLTDPALWHRLQFAFTIVYHYLFPQLTMGLAWFLVYWKWRALRTGEERYNQAVRFWARIFGLNFAVGVVTGIPMEFQFGTNWSAFSKYSGAVIGQTLAMEGMFAFFLESAFILVLVFGEKRVTPFVHFLAAFGVALGSWLSAYFIIATNAFMQHPVGYEVLPDGTLGLASLSTFLLNPWIGIQFVHNQCAAVVTGAFVVAALGAFYTLRGDSLPQASLYLRSGTFAGFIAAVLVAFPTGDQQAKMVARDQPVTLAAMEGRFHGGDMASLAVIGQPDVALQRLDNPIVIPGGLSFLANGTFESNVRGLDEFPQNVWPDNIELLYYSFHLMVTLGSLFILIMGVAVVQRFRGKLETTTPLLWALMLSFPFPYIANTLGWMTAELGRQPWLVYNLFRTADGYSHKVSNGDTIFTLIGFVGLYMAVGIMFLFLVGREIHAGPEASHD